MTEDIAGIKTVSDEVYLKSSGSAGQIWKINTDHRMLKLRMVNDSFDLVSPEIIINRKGTEVENIIYDGIVFTPYK